MAVFLIILGVVCLVAGGVLFTKSSQKALAKTTTQTNNAVASTTNKDKGNLFEDFVIQYIATNKEIKLISKVSDYHKNGVSAIENKEPDLKFEYKSTKFAVECKWRKDFKNQKITWAKEYQISNYNDFAQKSQQKVFIAIGIGGMPNKPNQLYIVPLYRLTQTFAAEDYIKEFAVDTDKKFHLN